MKFTVLSDNRSLDSRLTTEHGLAILLETNNLRVLLDTGAGEALLRNAEQLGVDLAEVDVVFISHGHNDHAGGLRHLFNVNKQAKVIVSPHALNSVFFSKRNTLHSITTIWPEQLSDRLLTIDKTCKVSENFQVIAHIPQIHPVPKGNRHLFVQDAAGNLIPDDFRHEVALYADGLLFTGCAHSGLENILAACPWPVHTVVGGFHLLDGQESKEELTLLSKRLSDQYPHTQFYTSHCTGDHAFQTMKNILCDRLHAFSCGMQIQLNISLQ